jgi:Uma2 family endonuclease
MEAMSTPETIIQANMPIRPLKRIEYERLAAEGFFEDEKVELLFGMVVPMAPIDWAHVESTYRVRRRLEKMLGERAHVYENCPFAASDISMPQPDLLVTESVDDWTNRPVKAFLVVEVARSSLRRDKGPKAVLYGLSDVLEYWIVDHVHGAVEVYRDPGSGEWCSKQTYRRGETLAMVAFPDVTIDVTSILPPVES